MNKSPLVLLRINMTFFDDARAIPVPFNLLKLPLLLLLYLPYCLFREMSRFLRGDRKNFARKRFEEHRILTQEQADRRMRYAQLMRTLIQRSQRRSDKLGGRGLKPHHKRDVL